MDRRGNGADDAAMPDDSFRYALIASPLGPLVVAGRDGVIHRIAFPRNGAPQRFDPRWQRDDSGFPEARRQVDAYFAGNLTEFDLPIAMTGGAFQMKVWNALRAIPYGETRSYGDIARIIGEGVAASRNVGTACGENPVPIVVPCHRVIGADGALVGFGGGLPAKRLLLSLERHVRPPTGAQMDLFG